ncbi:MAG: carbohydrate porin [Bacteroidaceae bacterium]
MKKKLMATMVGVASATSLMGQALHLEGVYTGDVLCNLSGGIKTGTSYLGTVKLGAALNTEKAKLWKGGTLRFSASNTHGGMPSAKLVGDCQTVSSIEAGNHTFLSELWYRQTLGKTTLTGGLQDFNAAYATSDYADNYINSSFGLFSTMSANFCAPTYPLTGLGIDVRYEFSSLFAAQTALFDGNVLDFSENPYNLKWNLSPHLGYLSVTELHYTPTLMGDRKGRYTLGGYYHTGGKGFGAYVTLSQTLWQQSEKSVNIFLQASYTERTKNENYAYVGGGVNATGVFCSKGCDWFGASVASAFFTDRETETTFELSYKRTLGHHFFVQPDVQYVVHPARSTIPLKNALIGILRFGMAF